MKRGAPVFLVASLLTTLAATGVCAAEVRAVGVKRHGVALVPIAAVAGAFGGELRWSGDVKSLQFDTKTTSICFVHRDDIFEGQPAPVFEGGGPAAASTNVAGETHVAVNEIAAALKLNVETAGETLTLSDGTNRLIVEVVPELPESARPRVPRRVKLPVYHYEPLTMRSEERAIEVLPEKTALVVIDFWGYRIQPSGAYDNTAELIRLARRNGIHIVHLPHDIREGVNPRILPLPNSEAVMNRGVLEYYFAERKLDIDTLLYTGYASAECVLYTRYNSINRLNRRTDRFRTILVKDTTHGAYWTHLFAVNGIETRYLTSTLNDLSRAFGEKPVAKEAELLVPELPPIPYGMDAAFGRDIDLKRTALVLINAWECDGDDRWMERVKKNNTENLLPLVDFARANGMQIIHVPNGREIDRRIGRLPEEKVLTWMDELRPYVEKDRIENIVYAGNLTNAVRLFAPIDPWQFTADAGLPANVRTRILDDALIVFETPESLPWEHFKKVFLERATYTMGDQHTVSKFSMLRQNAGRDPAPPFKRGVLP